MSNPTILVIDDSATIRKFANGALCNAGYQVVLASTAEDGIAMASEQLPDLILLDHQLPGTTGLDVCQKLLASDRLRSIPVIISSTLRKRAYMEYADCSNVIDMLPKPYTEDSLASTVQQGLETGSMVVASQTHGTAVPEVINAVGNGDLCGSFSMFSLREVLDFLNNGVKNGVLEVESDSWRAWFYLRNGRVQAVTANGIDVSSIIATLPESLRSLAPILNLTMSGRSGSELDGVVQLLNTKVVDARLLGKLLRHQASMLSMACFTNQPKEFRFEPGNTLPPLFRDVPLDISLLALLVEASKQCDESLVPEDEPGVVFARQAIRGQNLDRAGLSAQEQKIVAMVSQPIGVESLAKQSGVPKEELRRILFGLTLANLVERQHRCLEPMVVLLEPNQQLARHMRDCADQVTGYQFKVVRDRLAFQLLLKRDEPSVVMMSANDDGDVSKIVDQIARCGYEKPAIVGIVDVDHAASRIPDCCDRLLKRPYNIEQIQKCLQQLENRENESRTSALDSSNVPDGAEVDDAGDIDDVELPVLEGDSDVDSGVDSGVGSSVGSSVNDFANDDRFADDDAELAAAILAATARFTAA